MQKDRESITIPARFKETICAERGQQECEALCKALEMDSLPSVRFNPHKRSSPPEGLEPIAWSRYGFYLRERPSFTLDSAFHAGTYYVQEASSQFVGHILSFTDVTSARIIDMCASPGGKSTLYSTLVGSAGLVLANEISKQRASVLADNARRWGMGNIVVSNNDSSHVAEFERWADVVAVDAPCSGEGMFRRLKESRQEWSENNVQLCRKRQVEILHNSWRALKAGGVFIYSTCTFNTIENEGAIEEFLAEVGDEAAEYQQVLCDKEWGVVSSRIGVFQCFRFFPHRTKGEGFFVAVARKSFDVGGRRRVPKPRKSVFSALDRNSLNEVSKWVESPEYMHFSAIADNIYGYHISQAEEIKRLAESLTVIYSGVAMGQIFKKKLKPDPALALYVSLNREASAVTALDEVEILSYLRKAELRAQDFEAEGINLVTNSAGDAVGWAKKVGGRINNLYPNSMRILNAK